MYRGLFGALLFHSLSVIVLLRTSSLYLGILSHFPLLYLHRLDFVVMHNTCHVYQKWGSEDGGKREGYLHRYSYGKKW